MKAKRVLLLFLSAIIALFCLASCSAEKEEPPELALLNRCASYIEEYSSATPADALELKKVADDCKAVLDSDIFDRYYEQSLLKQNSVISGREDEYKESHLCEIMMLRLKCLLLSGETRDYNTEFLKYIKEIDSNTFTRQRFPEFFKNDSALTLTKEQLEAAAGGYAAAAGSCSDEIEKYILYNEEYSFISFYSDDEAQKEKLYEQFNGIKEKMGNAAFEKHYNEWSGFDTDNK